MGFFCCCVVCFLLLIQVRRKLIDWHNFCVLYYVFKVSKLMVFLIDPGLPPTNKQLQKMQKRNRFCFRFFVLLVNFNSNWKYLAQFSCYYFYYCCCCSFMVFAFSLRLSLKKNFTFVYIISFDSRIYRM